MNIISQDTEQRIFSVSELNSFVRMFFEENFAPVWITGEISNLIQPHSGHIYFSLKDAAANVRCVMFRGRNSGLNFKPQNGSHVTVLAQITLYEPRGDYQLIVNKMEEAGAGLLHEKFLKLKDKLAKEGLFDLSYKKVIPKIPNCIGVITSPTGAAIRDILSVLKRRFPGIPIIIYPTQVQGNAAAAQIVAAIKIANLRKECNVLLLARGGGSIEDLWPFNEEIVARAIFASEIPMISGIGHEIDFTIADFVADQRAPTPSAAAELVAPDVGELLVKVNNLRKRILLLMQHKMQYFYLHFNNLKQRLKHPKQILEQNMQRLDDLDARLQLVILNFLKHKKASMDYLQIRLKQYNPLVRIQHLKNNNYNLQERMQIAIKQVLATNRQKLNQLMQVLDTVSPLSTLKRGYAIVSKDVKILRSINDINVRDKINARLYDGELVCEILKKNYNNK